MRSLNKISLIGNVGSKSDIKQNGEMKVINLSLATSDKKKDGKEDTQWHRLVAFGATADVIDQYVHKGQRLYVEGKLVYGKYSNKEGVEIKTADIIVNNLIMLGGKGEPESSSNISGSNHAYEEQNKSSNFDDDIPF